MQTAIENVWIANLLTGAVVVGLLGFFGKRLLGSIDKRFDRQDERIANAEEETEEVKKNYIRRFELVHEKIDETKDALVEEIQKVQTDKEKYRYEQAKQMGVLETKIDGAVGYFKEMREDIKELRRDNRDFDRNRQ